MATIAFLPSVVRPIDRESAAIVSSTCAPFVSRRSTAHACDAYASRRWRSLARSALGSIVVPLSVATTRRSSGDMTRTNSRAASRAFGTTAGSTLMSSSRSTIDR